MKNVLILTVDCWNTNIGANSSQTYSSLFSTMKDYNVYNIYIREELPNDSCCKRYFQISERRLIKHFTNRKIKSGKEVLADGIVNDKDIENILLQKEIYDKHRKKFYYTKKIIRELIWWISSWKSKELDDFLESIKPDVVIFSMEGYIHFNRLCRYVLKRTRAKGIGYFWDDNFTYKQRPGNLGYYFLRYFQRKSLKKLSKKTHSFLAISPKTKEEADKFFNINCTILSKPTDRELDNQEVNNDINIQGPIKLLYAGNLMIGRLDTLKMVIEVLEKINRNEIKIILDVYSGTKIPDELLNLKFGVNFHSPVSQSEILSIQEQSNILLFIEDVIGKERKVARLSFSTKIPDYLSCGKCIIAIGDRDTAPMKYFEDEKVALCAQNKKELEMIFEMILNNSNCMNEFGQRALNCAIKNHKKTIIQQKLREIIESN